MEGKGPMRRRPHDALGGGPGWGDPPPPSLVGAHGASRERISPIKEIESPAESSQNGGCS